MIFKSLVCYLKGHKWEGKVYPCPQFEGYTRYTGQCKRCGSRYDFSISVETKHFVAFGVGNNIVRLPTRDILSAKS